ncbi:MAG: ParA family protein [Solirubrobacteraceae bacterium]
MIITVGQQKGGTAKTTTAANVAVLLARHANARVLAVDTDPQATLTRQLGIAPGGPTLVDVLAGRLAVHDAIESAHGVDVLPASRELAGAEMALVSEVGRERALLDALEPIREDYGFVVIDTPPNLGLLTVNGLMVADVVVAPVSAEDSAAAQGVAELRATLTKLARLRNGVQPPLVTILTRWAPNRVMGQLVALALSELGVPAAIKIPSRAAVALAGASQIPVAVSAPDGDVALAYRSLVTRLTTGKVEQWLPSALEV